mgnify:CR=1 FL=1
MPRRRLFGNTLILLHNEFQVSAVHKFTYTFIRHQYSVTRRFEVSLFRGKTYEVSILKKKVYSILKSLGVAVLSEPVPVVTQRIIIYINGLQSDVIYTSQSKITILFRIIQGE